MKNEKSNTLSDAELGQVVGGCAPVERKADAPGGYIDPSGCGGRCSIKK